jgi:transposase
MAYRLPERYQIQMFPEKIEDYVPADDVVRVFDAFVNNLDLEELGFEINSNKKGCCEYEPGSMLKLLLYGYSYGIRSSRKLERAVNHNITFIWLVGGLKPDHKTIARFRKNNKKQLKQVIKQCARLCIKLNLISGNTLFLDGSKIRANAGIKNSWSKDKCEKYLKEIDKRIDEILEECDDIDKSEENQDSWIKVSEELNGLEKLKQKVSGALKEIQEEEKTVNTTDKDCLNVKSRQGIHAGYNAQIVTDNKNGLIVNSDVVAEANDRKQFSKQIDQANEVLEKQCKEAIVDSGYTNIDDLKKIDDKKIDIIIPLQKDCLKGVNEKFSKENFVYSESEDIYICPEGYILKHIAINKKKNTKIYRIEKKEMCITCSAFGECTKNKKGRHVQRLVNENLKEKLKKQYEKYKEKYKLRKEKVEHQFGHIKRNLNGGYFLLRGLEGVNAEMSILATCFNITRMKNILGIPKLIQELN